MTEPHVFQAVIVLLSLSLSGTLLFLFLYLIRPLYQSRLSKSWQYYIWVIVCIRFLLPFTPAASISGYLFRALEADVFTKNTAAPVTEHVLHPAANSLAVPAADNMVQSSSDTVSSEPQANKSSSAADAIHKMVLADVVFCLALLWLMTAIVLIIRKIMAYQYFCHFLKAGSMAAADIEMLNLLSACVEKLRVGRQVELYQSPLVSSPMTIGYFHPCILLPTEKICHKNLVFIFLHELIHIKRRDLLYKWLVQAVVCIHWPNPFVRLLGKEINRACELSCDEAVLALLENEKERKAYGDMLLFFVRAANSSKYNQAPGLLTEGAEQLKERLGAIMNYQKRTKTAAAAAALLTALVCFCFTALGAYAAPVQTAQTSDKTQVETEPANASGRLFMENYTNKKSESGTYYSTTRQGFYCDSYLMELQWNIHDPASYADSAAISLADQTKMTVYFHKNTAKYAHNKKALTAAGKVISSLQKTLKKMSNQISRPAIVRMIYIPASKVPAYVEKYFEKDDLVGFSALFPALDPALQPDYAKKAYQNDDIAVFSIVLDELDDTLIRQYTEKSLQDERVDFLSVLLDAQELQDKDLARYAKAAYASADVACFHILADSLDQSVIRQYTEKAVQDERVDFLSILLDTSKPQAADITRYAKTAYKKEDIACFSILVTYMSTIEKQSWMKKALKDSNLLFYSVLERV